MAFQIEDCEPLETCYGNNPVSPYLLFNLPPHPDHPTALPPSALRDLEGFEGMSPAAFLADNEAFLIRGRLPPAARYVGFTPYLFTREGAEEEIVTTFASLTDTLNHVNLSTGTESPFDAEVAIIVTSDADTLDAARAMLEEEGTPADIINEVILPRDALHLGFDDADDTVMLLGRIALFEDASAGEAYLSNVPLDVSRLTPADGHTGDALAVADRLPRGDGVTEDPLEDALDALEEAIASSLSDREYEPVVITSSAFVAAVISPELCMDQVSECLGDNADTTYAAGPIDVARGDGALTLGPDASFIVFGVNHEASGKAEYSNMSVYAAEKQMGVISLNSPDMPGTADRYLPDHPLRDQLFATEIRRDCTGRQGCMVLPETFPGVGLEEDLFFIFRAYINPGLSVSPAHSELLTERVFLVPDAPD